MNTVAIIGASSNRSRFSNKAIRAFLQKGYTVFPVNPMEPEVEGLKAYGSIRDLPERPQIISVYVRPDRLLKLLPDIAARGCDELWLNPGTASTEVLEQAKQLGLKPAELCSILALGMSPAQF